MTELETQLFEYMRPADEDPIQYTLTAVWRDCPNCGKTSPGVVHADGWMCGECLTTTPAASTSSAPVQS